jgi:hypothetical protein
MGYDVHDVLRKVVVYYTKNHKFIWKNYDLKLLSFLKAKHSIYNESLHFQNFTFIQKS